MKILNAILTLGCLGGLVSCYPALGQNNTAPRLNNKKTVSLDTPATELERKQGYAAAQMAKMGQTNPLGIDPLGIDPTIPEVTTPGGIVKKEDVPKPVNPKEVKTAKRVPGKAGFVFNPYTFNHVDVTGVPSGVKVRDPHDPNLTHVFRVP